MTKRWCCDTIRQSDIVIDQGFLPPYPGGAPPQGRQLILRGEGALARFTTWKAFKSKVFHLIYFKRQGSLKQMDICLREAWWREGKEPLW